jgi:hypothetical protein
VIDLLKLLPEHRVPKLGAPKMVPEVVIQTSAVKPRPRPKPKMSSQDQVAMELDDSEPEKVVSDEEDYGGVESEQETPKKKGKSVKRATSKRALQDSPSRTEDVSKKSRKEGKTVAGGRDFSSLEVEEDSVVDEADLPQIRGKVRGR